MKTFINVAQMKLASLKEGQFVETGGYYTKGDAGQAKYLIVAAQAADEYGDHTLANGTVAVLQVSDDVNVLQFGAVAGYDYVGDIGTNSTAAIQAAFDSIGSGTVFIPAGHYKADPLLLLNKNPQNEGPQLQFKVRATGAKIWSTATGSANAFAIESCKRLVIEGLMIDVVSGVTPPDYNVGVRGLWNSRFIDCDFKSTSFGIGFNSPGFNSIYWNYFDSCRFAPITFDAGEEPTRRVINSNLFSNCNVSGGLLNNGDYAFYKFGVDGINAIKFVSCDISYYNVSTWYIDAQSQSYVEYEGGYFDSSDGIPLDTKGMRISTTGPIQTPNSANTNSFYLESGSYVRAAGNGGINSASRDPSSCYNLMKNGSMRAEGVAGFTNYGWTVQDISTQAGYFKNYKYFSGSTDYSAAVFKSIPLPYDGYYTVTVIAKSGTGVVNTKTNLQYNTLQIGSEWTITSITQLMSQDDVFEQAFTLGEAGPYTTLDIAYVGLVYGSVGNLGAPEHPDADLFNAVQILNGFDSVSLGVRGPTGLPNSTIWEDTNNGLSYKDKNGVVKTINLT